MDKRTYDGKMHDMRTQVFTETAESEAVWEQLLALAEGGDIRAIKLYYEMLDKKQRGGTAHGTACGTAGDDSTIEQIAAIRRAVFGDEAVDAAAREAAGAVWGTGGRSPFSVSDRNPAADPDAEDL